MQPMQKGSLVLALDRAGNPSAWLDSESAVRLIAADRVLALLGRHARVVYGGINAASGKRSRIEVSSVLLTRARVERWRWQRDYAAPLTNRALFARDDYLSLYCGQPFSPRQLTRDHVLPLCRGGVDGWSNVVSACGSCNQRKSDRTPAEWGIELLAVPYAPCYAEQLILNGKSILADQMAFLRARVRRG